MQAPLYHITRPAKHTDKKTPLVLLLHGYGSDENDLFSFANYLPDEWFIVSARAPLSIYPMGYAWYSIYFDAPEGKFSNTEEAKNALTRIDELIDYCVNNYPVVRDKISLLGFSQGCILALAYGLTHTNKVKNIIGLSGYLNQELIPPLDDLTEMLKKKQPSVYLSHGTQDEVIPFEWSKNSGDVLKKLLQDIVFESFPVGHGVAPENFKAFLDWMQQRI
ncbi:MAG: alpha/beta hydrolase-fold protein [Flavobacteriaceae bacterium]|nr:alpha/beta hydrolase-fold protein [Flavobacteriaceae bacterium]